MEPKERERKNVINQKAIKAANFIWSVYLLIMLDTLLLRPSLQFTTLSFGLTPFKFPATPFHLTSLHFTSHHYTSPHITTLHLTSLHFTALLDDFRRAVDVQLW